MPRAIRPGMVEPSADLMRQEKTFYDGRWENQEITPREARRISATVAAVPSDCHTILDVGAGDGRLSQELHARGHRVVAFDLSQVALARLPAC
jgi:2-polyprenyl-3-methyl-5-hydroxy-6-metoxy-1,4-benzoquinol methylase